MKCWECNSLDDVCEVYVRYGWGRTSTKWDHESRPLCRRCRASINGHWKYKDWRLRKPTR